MAQAISIRSVMIVFWVLFIVTIVEVAMAIYWPEGLPKGILDFFLVLFTLVKAYFIVAEFMHLKYELRPLIIMVLSPLILFIWFILAFIIDGTWWGYLKQWIGL